MSHTAWITADWRVPECRGEDWAPHTPFLPVHGLPLTPCHQTFLMEPAITSLSKITQNKEKAVLGKIYP